MIYGIGRNYAKHAKELGNQVSLEAPIVFFKPDGATVESGVVQLPPFSQNVHFEGEIAYRLGADLEPESVCIALDMTARDKQKEAQEKKLPWALAKGFKQSCALGTWAPWSPSNDWDQLEITLTLNGELRQKGYARDMIFKIPKIQEYLKAAFPLLPGDIVLTGTPEGVGQVVSGDVIEAQITGVSQGRWEFK